MDIDQGLPHPIVGALKELVGHVPQTREPPAADPQGRAEEIIAKAAREAAMVSGSLSLPPGPLALLTVLPDLVAIWRLQSRMVADIAGAYGQQANLTREHMLYCLFRHAASQALRDLVVRGGERLILRKASTQVMQSVLKRVGSAVTQRLAGRTATRWLPVIGAMGVAAYAWYDTRQVGATAVELFGKGVEGTAATET